MPGKQVLYCKQKNRPHATHFFNSEGNAAKRRHPAYPFFPQFQLSKLHNDKKNDMQLLQKRKQAKKLVEAIVLQAIEDLWSPVHKKASIKFFTGEGFVLCAKILGMGLYEKLKLLQIIKSRKINRNHPKRFLKQARV